MYCVVLCSVWCASRWRRFRVCGELSEKCFTSSVQDVKMILWVCFLSSSLFSKMEAKRRKKSWTETIIALESFRLADISPGPCSSAEMQTGCFVHSFWYFWVSENEIGKPQPSSRMQNSYIHTATNHNILTRKFSRLWGERTYFAQNVHCMQNNNHWIWNAIENHDSSSVFRRLFLWACEKLMVLSLSCFVFAFHMHVSVHK